MNYRFAYSIGFHPWEDAASDPPFVNKFSELLDREEKGRQPPYGPVIDLGTGSGIWGIELAKRGWQVTGVDLNEKALRRAHERVQAAGVDMQLVQGDVTALRDAGVGSGFQSWCLTRGRSTISTRRSARQWGARSARSPHPMRLCCYSSGRSGYAR